MKDRRYAPLFLLSTLSLIISAGAQSTVKNSPPLAPQANAVTSTDGEVTVRHEDKPVPKLEVKVGDDPYGVVFDGANIWTANHGADSVTKVRANDGKVLGNIRAGRRAYGVVVLMERIFGRRRVSTIR